VHIRDLLDAPAADVLINEEACPNMWFISLTLSTLQALMSWSKAEAELSM
jgi:hypothetical protein